MEEAYIKSRVGKIDPAAWAKIVQSHRALEPMPERVVTNPFTGEKHLQNVKGSAAVRGEDPSKVGFALCDGEIFAYGVSLEFCEEIAALLNAEVHDFINRG
jgi:hypothetical protein